MPRPMNYGTPPPPLSLRVVIRDFMRHQFTKRPQPDNGGVGSYSYDALAVQQTELFAGYGVRTGAPLGYGTRPLVALPTAVKVGQATLGGRVIQTPLSDNPNG